MPRHLPVAAAAAALALILAACGQKEGVHVGFEGGGGGASAGAGAGAQDMSEEGLSQSPLPENDAGIAPVTAPGSDATTEFGAGSTAAGTSPVSGSTGGGSTTGSGQTGGSGSGGTSGGSGSTSGSGSQPPPGTGGGQPPAGGGGGAPAPPADTAENLGPVIRIGFHAPLTGAAPIPASSFEAGKRIYWDPRGPVHGRQVEVHVRDDKYNPASATQVCNELIQKQKVFMLVGGGGTDQIAACARTAAQQNIPYLSAGVTEHPLDELRHYFAFSMSYAQQAPLLVQWITKNRMPTNKTVGVLRSDTPNFDDGIAAFIDAAEGAGLEVKELKLSKKPSPAELSQAAQFLLQNQIEVAYPLMAPSDWVQIAKQPAAANTKWAGVGITMGLNTVASAACPEIDEAMMFSPWPGLNLNQEVDPGFAKAGGGDDIVWSLWAASKTLDQILTKNGPTLNADTFMRTMETNRIASGIYPNLAHTPTDHFGADSVHVLIADCGQRQWVSTRDGLFRRSF